MRRYGAESRPRGWIVDKRWRAWRRRGWLDRAGVYLAASAGGAAGGMARWGVSVALPTDAGGFPWSTLLVNVVGSLLIGVLMVLILDVWAPRRYVRPFLVVGVLGGFTTFSTYMVDTRTLFADGAPALAGVYLLGTIAAGLTAVWLGAAAAQLATRIRRR